MARPERLLRCFIVDDSRHFVDAARSLLEQQGVLVVGVASTSAEALRGVEELRPDVTLVDVDLGQENGFDLTERLHRDGASASVILISTNTEQDFADLIAASPAVGFLSKSDLSTDAILDLLRSRDDRDDSDPAIPVSGPRGTRLPRGPGGGPHRSPGDSAW
jgi:DNA-binding NarL/FixJ family response regulator